VIALQLLSNDASITGAARQGLWARVAGWISIALILACVAALGWSWLHGAE